MNQRKTVLSVASGAAAALATTTDSNPVTALQQLYRSPEAPAIAHLILSGVRDSRT